MAHFSSDLLPFYLFILSGGRIITVQGNGFLMAQNVSMVVNAIGKEQTVSFQHWKGKNAFDRGLNSDGKWRTK